MAKTRLLALTMSTVVGLSLVGAAPVAAQPPVDCIGGLPSYWQDPANEWPVFKVPKLYTKANTQTVTVRPWTAFDKVFRYRRPRHDEGRILPGRTLTQVVNRTGGGLDGLARQAVAALLNAGAGASNEFPRTRGYVIDQFQVYWDGTEDMSAKKARRHQTAHFLEDNGEACPVL
jgi:hypothetical protein